MVNINNNMNDGRTILAMSKPNLYIRCWASWVAGGSVYWRGIISTDIGKNGGNRCGTGVVSNVWCIGRKPH